MRNLIKSTLGGFMLLLALASNLALASSDPKPFCPTGADFLKQLNEQNLKERSPGYWRTSAKNQMEYVVIGPTALSRVKAILKKISLVGNGVKCHWSHQDSTLCIYSGHQITPISCHNLRHSRGGFGTPTAFVSIWKHY